MYEPAPIPLLVGSYAKIENIPWHTFWLDGKKFCTQMSANAYSSSKKEITLSSLESFICLFIY